MATGLNLQKILSLDTSVYSAEAIELAAYIFEERLNIATKQNGNVIDITFNGCNEADIGDFCNEVLNQQCRIDLSKSTTNITKMIVAKSLLSAIGDKEQA